MCMILRGGEFSSERIVRQWMNVASYAYLFPLFFSSLFIFFFFLIPVPNTCTSCTCAVNAGIMKNHLSQIDTNHCLLNLLFQVFLKIEFEENHSFTNVLFQILILICSYFISYLFVSFFVFFFLLVFSRTVDEGIFHERHFCKRFNEQNNVIHLSNCQYDYIQLSCYDSTILKLFDFNLQWQQKLENKIKLNKNVFFIKSVREK